MSTDGYGILKAARTSHPSPLVEEDRLIAADGGGSNGSSARLWKREFQTLANEIDIVVHHLPPGYQQVESG